MTMPSLIANYQKKENLTKLKKAYSVLNQAFKMSEASNGSSEHWEDAYDIGAEAYYNQYWKPFFNNSNLCKTYKECGFNSNIPYKYLNKTIFNVGLSMSADSRIIFYLPDGTLYAIFVYTGIGTTNAKTNMIIVDINGGKNPNTVGKDVFIFKRINGKGILPEGYENTRDEINQGCNLQNEGRTCAAKIIQDGWEISKDYPW